MIPTPVLRYSEEPDFSTIDPALRSTSEPASSDLHFATLAQLVEQRFCKPQVIRSSRMRGLFTSPLKTIALAVYGVPVRPVNAEGMFLITVVCISWDVSMGASAAGISGSG